MKILRKTLAAIFLAAAATGLAASPQLAFLGADDAAPDVFKASEVSRVSFDKGQLSLTHSDGVKTFQASKLRKVVFDSDNLYSAIGNVTETPRQGSVTPNPVNDYFSVEVDAPTPLSVFTITGSRVIHIPNYNGGQVNATTLPQGIYIVKTRTYTAKFIKL